MPLTSKKCVDLIITDMAVMEVTQDGLILQELMSPYTVEDIKQHTEADFQIGSNLLVMNEGDVIYGAIKKQVCDYIESHEEESVKF